MDGMHLADIDWLPILRRSVAVAALAMALAVVGVWVGNFALIGQVAQNVSAGPVLDALLVLGWVEIVAAAAVVLGMAVGWWFHRPLWAPGVLFVVLGMALHWGWWFLDRKVDLFGTFGFNDPDPELVRRAAVRMWVMLGVDSLAVLLLLLGAVLLFWRSGRSGQAGSASEGGSDAADGDHHDVGRLELQGDGAGDDSEQPGVEGNALAPAAKRVQHR
jgi:hypothetical protein